MKDLTGNTFGRLTAITRIKGSYWLCECECGNKTSVRSDHLKSGRTKSCGCLNSELSSDRLRKKETRHGQSRTKLYKKWASMKNRCSPNSKGVKRKNYYERGIRVCNEWQDFERFFEWAIESGYKEGMTIDRIDNDGNYEPSNCRWATIKEQENNRRDNNHYEYKGEKKTLSQWCDVWGIDYVKAYSMLRFGTFDELAQKMGGEEQ